MPHDSHHKEGAEQIRCVIGDHHKAPDQQDKHDQNRNRSKKSKLFTDNGKDHIVLGLRQEPQLLHALPKSFSQNALYAIGSGGILGKGLGQSDTVLYNRAAVVEKLQRKLDSYQINERTGNRAQALDALLSGAAVYDDIMAAGNAYGAENELAILYQQIIDTLQSQFQVDEAIAREVNSYESDDDYSEAVYSLINNGKLPESETEETEETGNATEQLPDLLPEEEDLMENVDSSF